MWAAAEGGGAGSQAARTACLTQKAGETPPPTEAALSRNRAGALERIRWSLDSFSQTFARLLLGLGPAIDAEGGGDAVL
jgi:hypothetical protein